MRPDMGTKHQVAAALALACILALLFAPAAHAQMTLRTLRSFTGTNGASLGAVPEAKLALGADGYFYGTTIVGGAHNRGTVYRVSTNGAFATIFSFDKYGLYPQAALEPATDGRLYGTTTEGGPYGAGTIFRITTNGAFGDFAVFNWTNGATPNGLIQARDGNFYGTTYQGGTNGYGQYGTIVKVSPGGKISTLYTFGVITDTNGRALDGSNPQGALMQGDDGALYGTTTAGGTNGGFGTIFRITTNGAFSSLFSFNGTNGNVPICQLARTINGNLYGTTLLGGIGFDPVSETGQGTLFMLTSNGRFTNLHCFGDHAGDGIHPAFVGLAPGTDGCLYGTTSAGGASDSGTIFRLNRDMSLEILYSFSVPPPLVDTNIDGYNPSASLIQGGDGNFYGVTDSGGVHGFGAIFCLSNSLFSRPFIQEIVHSNATTTLTWVPLAKRRYQLQYKTGIDQRDWNRPSQVISGTGPKISMTNSAGPFSSCWYRLVLLP